jgi:hypothetical protein
VLLGVPGAASDGAIAHAVHGRDARTPTVIWLWGDGRFARQHFAKTSQSKLLSVRRPVRLQTSFGCLDFSVAAAFLLQQIIFNSADTLGGGEDVFPFGVTFAE